MGSNLGLTRVFEYTNPLYIESLDQSIKPIIYPNPSTGIINIAVEDIVLVQVINSNGQLIMKQNNNMLDLSQNKSGIYWVNVITKNETFTQKIVIQ